MQQEGFQQAPAAAPLTREQINRQRALESQMQSLYELEYREEVLVYMHEMEVSVLLSLVYATLSKNSRD